MELEDIKTKEEGNIKSRKATSDYIQTNKFNKIDCNITEIHIHCQSPLNTSLLNIIVYNFSITHHR